MMIKKIFITLLVTINALVIIPNFLNDNVNADSFPCEIYSVDYINDQGGFDNIGCYSDYASAKAKMKENEDYVVRHAQGYSPTKIVAMNSGLVYSYPRGSSSTMNIYQDYSNKNNTTTTYLTSRYEMTYVDTEYMSAVKGHEAEGYTKVIMNGFEGYADTEYCDLVPSKYIDNGIPIYLGGSYGSNSIEAVEVIVEPNYYVLKQNNNYVDLEFHYHQAYPDSNGYAQSFTLKVDNGANYTFMTIGTKYYSDDGINFYTDYKKTNKVGTCYNYYQFLSIRTKTSISGSTMDNFIKSLRSDYSDSVIYGKCSSFVSLGEKYGANGALIFALACQESAYGISGYAKNRNNLFGWNAYDDSPNDASYFSSVDVAIKEQMGRNLRKYADINDYRYNGTYVGSKGSGFNLKYASDPYWGMKIAAIYYNLDKFSCGGNGKLTDHNKYDLALIETFNANIYKDSSGKEVLFTSKYNDYRQENNIVVVLEEIGDYYKIQCSNPISNGQLITDVEGIYEYSWSESVAYIKKSDVTLITNNNTIKKVDEQIEHDPITVVDELNMSDGIITISGIGALSNYNYNNADDITHKINIYDLNTNQLVKTIECEHLDTSWYVINDGYSYTWAGFKAQIDIKEYSNSTYIFKLETTYKSQTIETLLTSSNRDLSLFKNTISDKFYKLATNDIYNYRIELDIMNNTLDYTNINKPSRLSSLATIDNITYDLDNNTITFKGVGMIYYLNYAENANIHKMYLIQGDNIIELETKTVESEFDYKTFYDSSYDMTYICYEATADITTLSGDYKIGLEISNGEYKDFIILTNRFNDPHNTLSSDNVDITYSVNENNRYEIIMNVDRKD